jgi:hypothetical protein
MKRPSQICTQTMPRTAPTITCARFTIHFSPTVVVISQARRRWCGFVPSLCRLVGGIYIILTLINGMLGTVKQRVSGPNWGRASVAHRKTWEARVESDELVKGGFGGLVPCPLLDIFELALPPPTDLRAQSAMSYTFIYNLYDPAPLGKAPNNEYIMYTCGNS